MFRPTQTTPRTAEVQAPRVASSRYVPIRRNRKRRAVLTGNDGIRATFF